MDDRIDQIMRERGLSFEEAERIRKQEAVEFWTGLMGGRGGAPMVLLTGHVKPSPSGEMDPSPRQASGAISKEARQRARRKKAKKKSRR